MISHFPLDCRTLIEQSIRQIVFHQSTRLFMNSNHFEVMSHTPKSKCHFVWVHKNQCQTQNDSQPVAIDVSTACQCLLNVHKYSPLGDKCLPMLDKSVSFVYLPFNLETRLKCANVMTTCQTGIFVASICCVPPTDPVYLHVYPRTKPSQHPTLQWVKDQCPTSI